MHGATIAVPLLPRLTMPVSLVDNCTMSSFVCNKRRMSTEWCWSRYKRYTADDLRLVSLPDPVDGSGIAIR